jgi:BASS family bile acid:Na+ symporter
MLRKFNSFIEKWMALVTPTCLLLGVCFPDIAKCGLPYVPAVFAFMTFAGALKSRFKDVANVFRHPGSLLIIMLLVHVVIPTAACGAGHLFFGNNMELITGMVLEFAVPTAVVSLMWVTIYDGNSPLSLSLVVLDTVLAPFLIPATLKILLGSAVTIDPARMMRELIFMVALPAVVAMVLNQITDGKVMETWPGKLAPFSKMCLIFVVTSNSSKVSPYMKHLNGERLEVAAAILVLAAGGYAIGWIIAILTRQNKEATVSMIYGSGMRNISAGAVIAGAYFPAETLFPVMIGTLFQQILAAFYGSMMRRVQTGQQEREKEHGVSA